jgi:hypothetical protein
LDAGCRLPVAGSKLTAATRTKTDHRSGLVGHSRRLG